MTTGIKVEQRDAAAFILGRQGLFPARRWIGYKGTVEALQQIEALQVDPLLVTARSHDLAMHARVLDYQPGYLETLLYQERLFFEYGGGLFIYQIDELPFWRLHMRRQAKSKRWLDYHAANREVVARVSDEIAARGPLGNRDFKGTARINSYRGKKDTSLALYYLWIAGELMIHHRENFQKVYDLRVRCAPETLDYEADEASCINYFARKTVAWLGLAHENNFKNTLGNYLQKKYNLDEVNTLINGMIANGILNRVSIAKTGEQYLMLSQDLPDILAIQAGTIPNDWRPASPLDHDEVLFLAPLDIVSARGRAAVWFNFEYLWEVYKPIHKRRWGYYTLPILYGKDLIARIDPKLDRTCQALEICGFWVEDWFDPTDDQFIQAFTAGLRRISGFLSAIEVRVNCNMDYQLISAMKSQLDIPVNIHTTQA